MKNQRLFLFFLFITLSLFCEESDDLFKSKVIFPKNDFSYDMFSGNSLLAFYDLFDEGLFSDKYDKIKVVSEINSFYKSYKSNFYKVELLKNFKTYQIAFFSIDGDTYYYNVKEDRDKKKIPINYSYSRKKKLYGGFYFYDEFNYDLFFEIYGKTKKERVGNLIFVDVLGKKVAFNKKNNAAFYLEKASKSLSQLILKDDEAKKWADSVTHIFTYAERKVANEERASLHTFGIAVDFITKERSKYIYWLWASESEAEWWNIPEDKKVYFPSKVVEIFEENGFCWGGRWKRFDIMHFEFRPEIALNPMNN